MQGHFDVTLLEAGRRAAEVDALLAAKRSVELNALLTKLPVAQRAVGSNLIFDNYAPFVFDHLFSGANAPEPFYRDSGHAYFAHITLETTDAEPTYTELVQGYQAFHSVTGSIGSGLSPSKRFIEDDVEAEYIDVGANQRESVVFRSRFLYASTQGNSADIRSLGVWFADNADSTSSSYRARGARIRLKDNGGSPIVINKTSDKVLLVEYTVSLVAI